MTSRMDTVSTAKTPNTGTRNTTPTLAVILRPERITMAHSTSDSSGTVRQGEDTQRSTGGTPGCALTSMSQAERPEAQVRRRVGDAAQAVLDGVDGLVQQHVCQVKLRKAGRLTRGLRAGPGARGRRASPVWGRLPFWPFCRVPPLHRPRRTEPRSCRPRSRASPSHNPEAKQQITATNH